MPKRMKGRRIPKTAVRIRDFSDRELLGVIADLAGANGRTGTVVEARDVALRVFGVTPNARNESDIAYFTKCVTARFTWMRRFGLLDKGEAAGEWYLSREGNALRRARLQRAVDVGIASSKDETMLALANVTGERMLHARPVEAKAMERELRFQIERRKRLTGR